MSESFLLCYQRAAEIYKLISLIPLTLQKHINSIKIKIFCHLIMARVNKNSIRAIPLDLTSSLVKGLRIAPKVSFARPLEKEDLIS